MVGGLAAILLLPPFPQLWWLQGRTWQGLSVLHLLSNSPFSSRQSCRRAPFPPVLLSMITCSLGQGLFAIRYRQVHVGFEVQVRLLCIHAIPIQFSCYLGSGRVRASGANTFLTPLCPLDSQEASKRHFHFWQKQKKTFLRLPGRLLGDFCPPPPPHTHTNEIKIICSLALCHMFCHISPLIIVALVDMQQVFYFIIFPYFNPIFFSKLPHVCSLLDCSF